MGQIVWAKPALDDLENIFDFIARDSHRYASSTIERITEATGRLACFPQLGQVLPEFPDSDYRQLVIGNYRLIYREDAPSPKIIVMGIIHGSRDLPAAFGDRR